MCEVREEWVWSRKLLKCKYIYDNNKSRKLTNTNWLVYGPDRFFITHSKRFRVNFCRQMSEYNIHGYVMWHTDYSKKNWTDVL